MNIYFFCSFSFASVVLSILLGLLPAIKYYKNYQVDIILLSVGDSLPANKQGKIVKN